VKEKAALQRWTNLIVFLFLYLSLDQMKNTTLECAHYRLIRLKIFRNRTDQFFKGLHQAYLLV